MMGREHLAAATTIAILNANYVAKRLEDHIGLLYAGQHGLIAHECILDTRPFKASAGVEGEDIAKRLIDYGVHPPPGSFPLAGARVGRPPPGPAKEGVGRLLAALHAQHRGSHP